MSQPRRERDSERAVVSNNARKPSHFNSKAQPGPTGISPPRASIGCGSRRATPPRYLVAERINALPVCMNEAVKAHRLRRQARACAIPQLGKQAALHNLALKLAAIDRVLGPSWVTIN